MKKILLSILIIAFLISNVSAWFPATYEQGTIRHFDEVASRDCNVIMRDSPLAKFFFPDHIPKKIYECDSEQLMRFRYDDKDYNYARDEVRMCYRACWSEGLEYSELQSSFFSPSECYCRTDDSLVQKKVDYRSFENQDYSAEHFRCYYFDDETECGKTRFCPTHPSKEFCEEVGGKWLLETVELELIERIYSQGTVYG